MNRNTRTLLIDQAEAALRCWHGDDMTREQATALLPSWRWVVGLDDDMRAEVLDRFPSAEPPSVPGLDFLPATQADAAVLVAEAVAVLDEPAPKPKQFRDYEGDLWIEQPDGSYACDPRDGSARCGQVSLASLRRMWGPLEEVKS